MINIIPCNGRVEELIQFVVRADLLASGVDWMLSVPTTKKINLTVNADNIAARSLYEKIGFVIKRIMRGYRKRVV